MKAFAKSDIGKVRENNQDSYYCAKEEDSLNLYIVADGMGGYNGGEVASSLAVAAVKGYFENNFASSQNDRESILALIRSAIEYANIDRKSVV